MTRFGRTELSKSVGDILSYLFEHQFSRTVRYTDSSGKLPLKDTVLIKAVRGNLNNFQLRLNMFVDVTVFNIFIMVLLLEATIKVHAEAKVKQINQAIAVWFRGSGDRGGGRIRRNGNKKDNKTTSSEVNGSSITENPSASDANDPDGNHSPSTT